MTQIDRPRFYRSDAHDDAVLTGPIEGLPMAQYATPHPSRPLPVVRAPRRPNGLAIAGPAVAAVGAVLSVVPTGGTAAWVLAPIGVVLSVVGLVRSGPARAGRVASIAGIVLGVVALLVCVLDTGVFTGAAPQVTAVHQVTYEVSTAKGTRITATYTRTQDDDLASASVSGARSPWRADAQVSGAPGPTLTASLSPDPARVVTRSDTITCTIVEDGVPVAHSSASGTDAMVTCTA